MYNTCSAERDCSTVPRLTKNEHGGSDMAKKVRPTIDELRQLLSYDPETGLLAWNFRLTGTPQWNGRYAGKKALSTEGTHGYLRGPILNVTMSAHRVAFAIHSGHWPIGGVDHINGDRQDNRAVNLREVNSSENSRNMKLSAANRSGQAGVHFYKQTNRWQAKIMHHGTQIHLGFFLDKNDAILARKDAEIRFGYHQNHGTTDRPDYGAGKYQNQERGPQAARDGGSK